MSAPCADPGFVKGPTLPMFFFSFLREGGRGQIPLKASHYRRASETPFKWRLAGGLMMAQHNTLNACLKLSRFFSGDPDQYC